MVEARPFRLGQESNQNEEEIKEQPGITVICGQKLPVDAKAFEINTRRGGKTGGDVMPKLVNSFMVSLTFLGLG